MGAFVKQYFWIVNIIAVLCIAYFAAKITNIYLGKMLEVNRSIAVVTSAEGGSDLMSDVPRTKYDPVVERNIFDSSELPAEAVESEGIAQEGPPVSPTGEAIKTSLPITLLGVLVVGAGKDWRSNAVVSEGGGKGVNVYAVGQDDSFAPGVKIVQVKPNRVEFLNNSRLEFAEIDDKGGLGIFSPPSESGGKSPVAAKPVESSEPKSDLKVDKVSEDKFAIDQSEIDNALQNLDKLYTEIRAVPYFKDGKVSGMKVLAVRPGSLFSKLGLQRGDILKSINGVELDVKRGFEIFSQLKDQHSFNLDLIRNDGNKTLEYEIR